MANKNVNLKRKSASPNSFDEEVKKVQAENEAAEMAEEAKYDATPVDDEYELIAGYKDEDGTLHTTFTIRDITGEDEEFFGRKKNMHPIKRQSIIIERLCTSIGSLRKDEMKSKEWHEVIQNLYGADADCIMLRIRASAYGDTLKVTHSCPECKAKVNTEMSFDEFNILEWDGEEGIHFELPIPYVDEDGEEHTSGVLRYIRQCDREVATPVLNSNEARGITIMLSRLAEFDDGYKITEKVLQKMPTRDRHYLLELINENQFGYDMGLSIECPECGNTFDGSISTGANFL